jgi:hypothetical protein
MKKIIKLENNILPRKHNYKKENNKKENNKQIQIYGKNNIDKINKIKAKRLITQNYNIDYNYEKQLQFLQLLYSNEIFDEKSILIKELKNKQSGYKQQDIQKKIYDESFFISIDKIIELLLISKLKCYYCKNNIFIFYDNVREPTQWTLERLDNNYGHNFNNCAISCLKCNIQRKNMNKDKFLFTKQCIITKT